MDWWISDGEIIGPAIAGINPSNFEIVAGPEAASRDQVYYNLGQIFIKPDRPSDRHIWLQNEWQLLTTQSPSAIDWVGMLNSLRGSTIFGKIYQASTEDLRVNTAYTLLTSTLVSTHNLEDFEWAIEELRTGMLNTSIGDFTSDDVNWINSQLESYGFTIVL